MVGLAHNPPHIVLLARHISQIAALPDHRLYGLFHVEALRSADRYIILRVEVHLRGHLTYNAAHIGICLYDALIDAESDLALLEGRCVIVGLRSQIFQIAPCRLVGVILHRYPLIPEQVVAKLIHTAAQRLGLRYEGVHIGRIAVASFLQHVRQPPQVLTCRLHLSIQNLQIVMDAATPIAGCIGHIAQMSADTLPEPSQCCQIALQIRLKIRLQLPVPRIVRQNHIPSADRKMRPI